MILLPEVEKFIRKFETCQLRAYKDRSGRWTIGYGWQGWFGPPIPHEDMEITRAEADELFHRAIEGFGGEIRAYFRAKKIELENDWQFSALLSLAYNKGSPTFARSEVVHHLMGNDPIKFKLAQTAFTHWGGEPFPRLDWMTDEDGNEVQYLVGLHRRRQSEGAIFDGIMDPNRFD